MNAWRVGRRGALSGALAAAVVGDAAAAPGVGAMRPGAGAPGQRGGEDADDTAQAPREDAEDTALHAPFRAAFLAWLDGAAGRFALPAVADAESPAHTGLCVSGVHPAIWISLGHDGGIDAGADWGGVGWDLLASLDVAAEPTPDGAGWENALFVPEARIVHPTREAAWRSDGFEPLLDWVNHELAPATHLALWRAEGGGATWARLVRDGAAVRTGRSIAAERTPVHLLPVHAAGAPARVDRVGRTGSNHHDRRTSMAIGSAVQRGAHVYVYDERGRQLAMLQAGTGPRDGLVGYTGATVSIRRGANVFTYDERGRQLSMTPAR